MSRKLKFCNPKAWGLSKCAFLLFPTFCFSLFTFSAVAQGVTKFGESSVSSANFVDLNGKIGNSMALDKGGHILPLPCNAFAVTHTVGAVAPVTKTVTYGVVRTTLSGASKCWITQNLGADNQATTATDNSDASAGWYWQFNRKQGYLYSISGTGHIPVSWTPSISETSDWLAANDPCSLSLGTGWRIPTSTEWANADATGGWVSYTNPYNSVLKLHAAGYLASGNGMLYSRGANGYYWSSTQNTATFGWFMVFTNSTSDVNNNLDKANGVSLRCLKD